MASIKTHGLSQNWRPASWGGVPSEPFTPIEQVCHVKDIEFYGYHERMRRMLDESNPVLASLDGEALERSYSTADTAAVFAQFRAARTKTIELVSRLTPQQLRRTAEFEGQHVRCAVSCTTCVAMTNSTWQGCSGFWPEWRRKRHDADL